MSGTMRIVELADDAAHHRFDQDLVARHDASVGHGLFHHIGAHGPLHQEFIGRGHALAIEEHRDPDDEQHQAGQEDVLEDAFHVQRLVRCQWSVRMRIIRHAGRRQL
jgi:hypothetical protein